MKYAMILLTFWVAACASKDSSKEGENTPQSCYVNPNASMKADHAKIKSVITDLVESRLFENCNPEAAIAKLDSKYTVDCDIECSIQENSK